VGILSRARLWFLYPESAQGAGWRSRERIGAFLPRSAGARHLPALAFGARHALSRARCNLRRS